MMGAQQPGMTGQVKEDILSRFNELGLLIEDGEIKISPVLLQSGDLLQRGSVMASFTYCNTPFVYKKGGKKSITVYWNDKSTQPLNYIPMLFLVIFLSIFSIALAKFHKLLCIYSGLFPAAWFIPFFTLDLVKQFPVFPVMFVGELPVNAETYIQPGALNDAGWQVFNRHGYGVFLRP
jgi:hypothetical protein